MPSHPHDKPEPRTPLTARALWLALISLVPLVSLVAAGCATLPPPGPARGLYVDLRKSVELSEDTGGWVVDRVEIESQAGTALRSLCRVDPVERQKLASWLDGELALEGGATAREIYDKHGGDFGAAKEAIHLERVRSLLRYAERHAEEDCPFWLHIEPEFNGIEGDSHRFVLWLESVGGGALVFERGKVALGGGGGGRVFAAYGIGPRATLALGGELSGNGAFVENKTGGRTIETTFTAATPVILRISDLARVYDFEVAPVARVATHESWFPPGMRVATSVGFSASRGSAFMPYVLLWLGYEVHAAHGRNPADHSIRIGTRVGVDLDP